MHLNNNKNINFASVIVVLLLFFLIDEFAFVLYNISLFQYMCANAFSLFLVDEVPFLDKFVNNSSYFLIAEDNTSSGLFCYVSDLNVETDNFFSIYHAIDYRQTENIGSLSTEEYNNVHKFYKVKMEATNVKKNVLSFYPLQTYIYTIPGESTLIFYRLENMTSLSMSSLSVYVTSPAEAVSYIKKLQCFCYEELMISPKCIIDLPILFSIDEEILNEDFNEITLNYILLLKEKK